jgi:hypothetical protein
MPEFNGTADADVVRFWAKDMVGLVRFRRKLPRSGMEFDLDEPADGSFATMPAGHSTGDLLVPVEDTNETDSRSLKSVNEDERRDGGFVQVYRDFSLMRLGIPK